MANWPAPSDTTTVRQARDAGVPALPAAAAGRRAVGQEPPGELDARTAGHPGLSDKYHAEQKAAAERH